MRASQYFYPTTRENPADAELVSHQLMVRAGMIRKVAGGIYNWLPIGLKVVRKVENIVREEMNRIGAIEVLMPIVQPAELWQASGRWKKYGPELMRLKDRHQRDFCLGPTHEEVITSLAGDMLSSYKQLPINFYQIQVKLRDEIRPRFGVMRGREFIMKDAYSFHSSAECLQKTYNKVYGAYSQMFMRMGLDFRAVAADTGSIGGNYSHEFQVLADSGEDVIAFSDSSDFAANIEMCTLPPITNPLPKGNEIKQLVSTPNVPDCVAVAQFLQLPITQILKSLIVQTNEGKIYLILIRGDFEVNLLKVKKLLKVDEVTLADEKLVSDLFKTSFGYLGPIFETIDKPPQINIIADYSVQTMADFAVGANKDNHHYRGINWNVDIPLPPVFDLRSAVAGDPSPDGVGLIILKRGIEVGHIFQLRRKYSEAMQAMYQDQNSAQQAFEMGCYGIGITRIVAAAIEQHHDNNGIIFPMALAPFALYIVPIGYQKSPELRAEVDKLYEQLINAGIDVYLDDRNERPGVMFADHELSGVPYRLVISEKKLLDKKCELISRKTKNVELIGYDEVLPKIKTLINNETQV